MSIEDLQIAESQNGYLKLSDIALNDIIAARGMLEKSQMAALSLIKKYDELDQFLEQTENKIKSVIESARNPFEFTNPTGLEIRFDALGDGTFNAPRGKRKHKGLDVLCQPTQGVKCPETAILIREGFVYREDRRFKLAYLESDNYSVKLMYCVPISSLIGKEVLRGQVIGVAQDITFKKDYKKRGMKPHIHIEVVRKSDGQLIDPEPLIFGGDI